MRRIESASPQGVRWIPQHQTGDAALVIAGSSGRIDEDRARVLAGVGVVAESVRWFGGPGQHHGPWEIPLETFLQRIEGLSAECDRVWMVGTSFGAEAALLCGSISSSIHGVVAFSPSDVVWAGYDGQRETSHWTHGAEPVPFVPFDWAEYVTHTPPRFRPLYERSWRASPDRVADATIPVEQIGRLILVAGGDDQVWPSVDSAERIRSRRARHGLSTEVVTTVDAGHRTILPHEPPAPSGMAMVRGGSDSADRRLGGLAWAAITASLESTR